MKKIVSLLIAVALIATFLCTAAFAAGTGTVSGVVNAKPGDTVTIPVSITGNPGFDAAGFEFGSSDYLTVTGVSAGAKMPNGYANGGSVNHFSSSLIEGDGVMCYVTVQVSEDVPATGTYYVTQVRGYVTNTDEYVASIGGVGVYVEVPEEPTETEPGETKPAETEPGETKPGETEPGETKPAETEPSETKPAETEPVETKPAETEPGETKPGETEPGETKPGETEPSETKPSETEPGETKPGETEPTESESTEPSETQKPAETDPGKDDEPKNGDITPYPVFFLLAVMAVAATAFVLKRKFDI